MNHIDFFLADVFERSITNNLGEIATSKIKNRLIEKYGQSISQAIRSFDNFDVVLGEFFGSGKIGVIQECMKNVCIAEQSKNSIEIKDSHLEKLILESFQDMDKKKVLRATMTSPMTFKEMSVLLLDHLSEKDANTKISDLIDGRILIPSQDKHDGVTCYYNVIDGIQIKYKNNEISLKINLKENIQHSIILQQIIR